MSDQLNVLKIVAGRLADAGIPYMVSGSMAMNYYAVPRMTRDIDVVVELGPEDVTRFLALFEPDFYLDEEVVRSATAERGFFNLIHLELVVKIDFVVRMDSPYRREEFTRRRSVLLDGMPVVLVAPEDLLLSKLVWAKASRSEIQLADSRNLVTSIRELDWGYVDRWAPELTVSALLEEVRR